MMQRLVVMVVALACLCQGSAATTDSHEPKEASFFEQKIVDVDPWFAFEPDTHVHTGCLHKPPPPAPSLDFPAGRPTPENLEEACRAAELGLRGDVRAPVSGQAWLGRRLDALGALERSLSRCCLREARRRLRCSLNAWERSLDSFCEQEAMVKDRQHSCCVDHVRRSAARHACFADEAPDPAYGLTKARAAHVELPDTREVPGPAHVPSEAHEAPDSQGSRAKAREAPGLAQAQAAPDSRDGHHRAREVAGPARALPKAHKARDHPAGPSRERSREDAAAAAPRHRRPHRVD